MSSSIRDAYHGDPTLVTLLSAVADRPAAYEYIKTASFDPDSLTNLPASAYAWEEERRFPIHSPQDAVASVIYRTKCAHAVPAHVDAKLAQAIEAYGISPDIFDYQGTKTASAPVEAVYAVPSQNRLPLGSPAQIKVAHEVLLRDVHRLDIETAVEAFGRLEKAASAHNLAVHPKVHTYAGNATCDTEILKEALDARQGCTKGEIRVAYEKLASHVPARGHIYDRETLVKIASRIHALDTLAGVEHHYGKRLHDPVQAVFNTHYRDKVAASPIEALMQLPVEIWQQVDVPEMAELAQSGDVQTFTQAYETLPRDIKMIIEQQM